VQNFLQTQCRQTSDLRNPRKSQSEQDSRLRICASRNPGRIPVCAFAQVAVRTGFPFAQLRKPQYGQISGLHSMRKPQSEGNTDQKQYRTIYKTAQMAQSTRILQTIGNTASKFRSVHLCFSKNSEHLQRTIFIFKTLYV
jgi:hypothetical protein